MFIIEGRLRDKGWFWLLVTSLLAVALWFVADGISYLRWWKAMAPYREQNKAAQDYYDQMLKDQAALEKLYAKDTYGGKTPQETWDMFVDALKKGDTDLAARYFIVEKQGEMKKNFKLGVQSGALETFLEENVPLIVGGDMYPDGNRFEFYTGDIDGGPGFVYMLVKNPITSIWKIEDL